MLHRELRRIERETPFVTVKHLSAKQIRAAKIPLPPIAEQRRIALILNQADALRAKRRNQTSQLDQLVYGLFNKLAPPRGEQSWPRIPLTSAYWFQEGPGVRNWQFVHVGVKLLNVGNIKKDGTLDVDNTARFISNEEAAGKYNHFLVDPGDLLVASSGISFDSDGLLRTRGAFADATHLPLCMNTSTIRFKAIQGKSDLRFLSLWLNGLEFREQITKRVTGSAQQNFGPTHLKTLEISLPPLGIQATFASSVREINQGRLASLHASVELDALFASLQHRAFLGEL